MTAKSLAFVSTRINRPSVCDVAELAASIRADASACFGRVNGGNRYDALLAHGALSVLSSLCRSLKWSVTGEAWRLSAVEAEIDNARRWTMAAIEAVRS